MSAFKQMYLFRLLHALHCVRRSSLWNKMPAFRRRKNIRMAADVSLALTCKGSMWSRALFSQISSPRTRKMAAAEGMNNIPPLRPICRSPGLCSRLRQPFSVRKLGFRRFGAKTVKRVDSSAIARKIDGNRKEILQRLVPGGTSMNTCRLLKETADYIVALQAQVQIMQFLANAVVLN
ncbi:transcription factor IBH1 [Cryptomeria japonica]|uniref:transcription factor IBH1 n=1 Tax=Cryptomeria japonica TaxID=3369 RepID=UPI0027DA1D1D|nr:transcription factor IBH1 [Cryptomeria japonica]